MQVYDGLVFGCAMILVCMYAYLGVQSQSLALKYVSPAIVGALTLIYALLPMRVRPRSPERRSGLKPCATFIAPSSRSTQGVAL